MEATGRQLYTMKLELGGVDDAAHDSRKEGSRRRVRGDCALGGAEEVAVVHEHHTVTRQRGGRGG